MDTCHVQKPSSSFYQFKDEFCSSHQTILRLAGEGFGRRLLDVGAADGFLAEHLTKQGWEVTGLESNSESASLARGRCHEIVTCDLNHTIPSLKGTFDMILYGDVLEHLLSPEQVLRKLDRYLAPKGEVIISVPNIAYFWIRLTLLVGRFDYGKRGILDHTHLHFFTLKTFRRFTSKVGLKEMEMVAVPAPLFLLVPDCLHGSWLRVLSRIHAIVTRCWPRGLSYQFVVKSRREL
jgi:2-polyprenyl-3-methyl-5-hydroxy-6-metoxy-1,4-benzoquinol methylase